MAVLTGNAVPPFSTKRNAASSRAFVEASFVIFQSALGFTVILLIRRNICLLLVAEIFVKKWQI